VSEQNRIETRDVDRTGWPTGPWDSEPDKVQWVDERTGLDCLAVRQPDMGHWCGYVGVPDGHPWHGKDYDDVRVPNEDGDNGCPDVHGGLTFSDACDEGGRICHVPQSGRPKNVWWLGFDCAHGGDRHPAHARVALPSWVSDGAYRDLAYVEGSCRHLARQAMRAAGSHRGGSDAG